MSQKVLKVTGEGGAHLHKLASSVSTENDGFHKHLFYVGDRLLMSDLSGAHSHSVDAAGNKVGGPGPHEHVVNVNTTKGLVTFPTKNASLHSHELQTEVTTLSGMHTHEIEVSGEVFSSILPGDLISEIEAQTKNVPALKEFKVRKTDDIFEMDFSAVQRLNQSDMKEIMKCAAGRAVLKSLQRIKEGFQVQRLLCSRDTFTDIGAARRFVLDLGFNVSALEEAQGVFCFQIHNKDRFDETSLQRVQITDGVIAVIGLLRSGEIGQQLNPDKPAEVSPAASLPENAVTPPAQPGASGTIGEFTDNMNTGVVFGKTTIKCECCEKVVSGTGAVGDTLFLVKCQACKDGGSNENTEKGSNPSSSISDDEAKVEIDINARFAEVCGLFGREPARARTGSNDEGVSFSVFFEVMKSVEEQRLVTGPILIPENFDLQDEIISPEEIRKSIHNYMIQLAFQNDPAFLEQQGMLTESKRGFMHQEFNRKVAFVEIWIAPMDMVLEGRNIKAGTAIGTAKVFDDEVWALVKSKKIRGFSIGGVSSVQAA